MKRPSLATRFGPWGALAVLLAAAAVAYGPALAGPFVLDDWGTIQANMRLRQPSAVRVPSPAEMLGPSRPVTEVTFAVDYRAAGLDPARFHAVSLALHLAAAVLAFAFLAPLLRRAGHPCPRGVALVVAGIFALHPVQAEAVAYAAQRSEVLASLLYLLALALLDRSAAGWGTGRGAAAWAGGALGWLLAMGSKTIAISVPGAFFVDQAVVAPASERGTAPLRRRSLRALALAAPLLALGAWSATLHFRSFAANPGGGAGFSETPLSAGAYFVTQPRVQWLYLRLLAWPRGLAFDRFFEPSLGPDGAVLAAGAGLVALLALAALGKLGRPAEALVDARRAVAPAPGDPLMRNVLGQALGVNGHLDAALVEFRAAEALDPGNPLFPVSGAIILAALDRREEACAAFRGAASRYRARPLPLDAAAQAARLGCPLPVP
jgi:tetratricopeptide (TPR) repeat protein